MTSILLTGGAGYIGSLLVRYLLERKFKIAVYDSLLYGGTSLLPYINHKYFTFLIGDIRDNNLFNSVVKNYDIIIHLAAIVGAPACDKNPHQAYSINVQGTKNVLNSLSPNQLMIFASTISVYGNFLDKLCDESSDINPNSHYAKSKAEAERIVHGFRNSIILRFATGFGVSPRLRHDLLINNFVFTAYSQKRIMSFNKMEIRAFVHVYDISKSILFTIENHKKMQGDTYNVGDNSLNLTKETIAKKIKDRLDCSVHFENNCKDTNTKNYIIAFDKVNKLGFQTEKTIGEGIEELIHVCPLINIKNSFVNL